MKFVELRNKKILGILDNIVDAFLDQSYIKDLDSNVFIKNLYASDHHPTSDEYLYEIYEDEAENWGYPRNMLGFDYVSSMDRIESITPVDKEKAKQVRRLLSRLQTKLAMHRAALSMYYPDNGYIGWHHNGNSPGLNILFTYSLDGDGYFKYRSTETGEIITLPDVKGWSVKLGYYPSVKDVSKEHLFWHTAYTSKERLSIAFAQKNNYELYNYLKDMLETE